MSAGVLLLALACGAPEPAAATVPSSDTVTVSILGVTPQASPRQTRVAVEITNGTADAIWVVEDPWFTWTRDGQENLLSLARERMVPGIEVFGYFAPKTREIKAGEHVNREITLAWPLPLSDIWNEKTRVDLAAGSYPLRVKVGYGRTPAAGPASTNVEEPVLAWQQTVVSDAGVLVVP